MTAYYNEIDPKAAAWIRELIKQGHVAQGEVDERSIVDVRGSDLAGFTQCHFFAGIGVWSHALRGAGWADERPVWTGSCPCQSFSAAGSGRGFDDERHLWPHFFRLIREQRPSTVFGEQVASKDGLAWLDFVCADMEGEGYAIAPLDLCAAGFGAPHIRQRLFFVADTGHTRSSRAGSEPQPEVTEQSIGYGMGKESTASVILADAQHDGHLAADGLRETAKPSGKAGAHGVGQSARSGDVDQLADTENTGQQGRLPGGAHEERQDQHGHAGRGSATGKLADTNGTRSAARISKPNDGCKGVAEVAYHGGGGEFSAGQRSETFWSDANWLPCRDGKARPVEPGTFPLAHGAAERVGRLRGYGNAIVAPVATEFIKAYIEERG